MRGGRSVPLRTCVGCRVRTAKSDLLRLVMVEGLVVPDPGGRLPGRGASLHLDPDCLTLAERRRGFSRAFRREGPFDSSLLRDYLEARWEGRAVPGPSGPGLQSGQR